MTTKKVFEFPQAGVYDGLNLPKNQFGVVFEQRLDDKRLSKEDNVLVATYPRTGKDLSWCVKVNNTRDVH